MTILWILWYLAVGFVVAVAIVRVTGETWYVAGVWSFWTVGFWPLLGLPVLLGELIKWCARRHP